MKLEMRFITLLLTPKEDCHTAVEDETRQPSLDRQGNSFTLANRIHQQGLSNGTISTAHSVKPALAQHYPLAQTHAIERYRLQDRKRDGQMMSKSSAR
jgi:hypothetical protein